MRSPLGARCPSHFLPPPSLAIVVLSTQFHYPSVSLSTDLEER